MSQRQSRSLIGFTLIEILVVAAIFFVIAGIVLALLSTSRERGQDTGRKETLRQLRNALELYHVDQGNYPDPSVGLEALVPAYIASLPTLDYFYATDCRDYGDAPVAFLLDTCFVLEVPLVETEAAAAGKCWRDDPLGVGTHDCYFNGQSD